MKTLLTLAIIPFLAGCITIGGKPTFPDAPEQLLMKCEELETINKSSILLSELMKTVARNYNRYHECATQIESWQEWYTKQRKNALKN